MTARDLMTRQFEVIHADATLEEVGQKLRSSGSSPLPVCKDGRLVGMISRREIMGRAAPPRREPRRIRVGDVIAPDLLYCFENTEVAEAASLMRENRIDLLPVLSPNKRIVGVLALKDIPGEI